MLPSTPHRLPDFDQAATDRRFLVEVDRLLRAGAFDSYSELATQLHSRTGLFSEIEAGRYHANLKLLYALAQHHPTADLNFILFGTAGPVGEKPMAAPARQRGRPSALSQGR